VNVFIIDAYVVFNVVEYLQVAFSFVSSVRFILVIPDACCQSGSPFERIGAVVSEDIDIHACAPISLPFIHHPHKGDQFTGK